MSFFERNFPGPEFCFQKHMGDCMVEDVALAWPALYLETRRKVKSAKKKALAFAPVI
jgi:hypothetical protein